jgi:fructose-specific phosphotransferase system IIC component
MEPNYSAINILAVMVPFLCYYFGIIVRKKVLSGKDSPPLSHQFLLGVPVSLVVVSPMLPVMITLGIIIEHGMLVNETATVHLKKLISRA